MYICVCISLSLSLSRSRSFSPKVPSHQLSLSVWSKPGLGTVVLVSDCKDSSWICSLVCTADEQTVLQTLVNFTGHLYNRWVNCTEDESTVLKMSQLYWRWVNCTEDQSTVLRMSQLYWRRAYSPFEEMKLVQSELWILQMFTCRAVQAKHLRWPSNVHLLKYSFLQYKQYTSNTQIETIF